MYSATENGVEKKIESWQIKIPLADNQQQPFPKEIIETIKYQIISKFGGLTSFNVVGYWKSGERLDIDENILIIIDVPVKYHGTASVYFNELKKESNVAPAHPIAAELRGITIEINARIKARQNLYNQGK